MRPCLLVILIATFTTTASAICIHVPSEIVLIEVQDCESSVTFAERATACLSAPWLTRHANRLVEASKGVVIKGRILESRKVFYDSARNPSLGTREIRSKKGAWLYTGPDPDSCTNIQQTTVELLMHHPCCDTTPPFDYPCFFDIGNVVEIPKELSKIR